MLVDAGQRAEGMAHLERAVRARAVGAGSGLRHRHDPAAGSEFRRRGGAVRGGAEDSPGLGGGAQQPRHRARLAGTHRRRAHPLRARRRAEAVHDRRARQSRSGPRRPEALRQILRVLDKSTFVSFVYKKRGGPFRTHPG